MATLKKQGTPQDLVNAWVLFRNLYLRPRGEFFYQDGFKPSPPFHAQMIQDMGKYARNVQAAPRGFSKSTIISVEMPLLLSLTRSPFSISIATATDRLTERQFDKLIIEFTNNPQIIADFGLMRPKRGDSIWNHHHLHLKNGSVIEGFSIMGRKRGIRPQLFILDDPEFDTEATGGTANSQFIITEKYEQILFRQIIPMLKMGSSIFWIGTMINHRCLLYRFCDDDDPRFQLWNRRVYTAENKERNRSLWPSAWPLEFLKSREAEIGSAAYSSEYLNQPLTDDTRLLFIDPDINEYTITNWSDHTDEDRKSPLAAEGQIEYIERTRIRRPDDEFDYANEKKSIKIKDLVGPMYRVLTVDTARGLTTKHDYRAIACLGFDRQNCLWILDLWLGRTKDSVFHTMIYTMGRKWLVRAIGIEACGGQESLVESMQDYVDMFTERLIIAAESSGEPRTVWTPRVIPIRYPSWADKPSRIADLEWRFNSGKIKYPAHLKHTWPLDALYEQTENFTKDLALLRWDDAIDSVAMSTYMVHARGRSKIETATKPNLLQQIKSNHPVVPGLPLLSGVNLNNLTMEELTALINKFADDGQWTGGEQTREKPNILGTDDPDRHANYQISFQKQIE